MGRRGWGGRIKGEFRVWGTEEWGGIGGRGDGERGLRKVGGYRDFGGWRRGGGGMGKEDLGRVRRVGGFRGREEDGDRE